MKSANRFLILLVAVVMVIGFAAVMVYAQPPKPAAPAEAPKPAAPAEAPKPAEAPPGVEAPKPVEAPAPPAVAPAPAPAPAPVAAAKPGTTIMWVNFILGLWLLISPWVTKCEGGHKWSTSIVGLIVAILSIVGALS